MKKKPRLPLSGVRILDFTWWQAGPQATLFLASLGAEVIKVESLQRPDIMRRTSVHFREGDPGTLDYSAHFYSLNYNKKSLALNLITPEGKAIARELAGVVDVAAENFAAGVMDRLGLGYRALKAVNPRIIMISITGMGQTGPESRYLSYAQTMHAFTGLSSFTGYDGGPPQSVGAYWGDHVSACTAALAVLSALHQRRRTGVGQYIDLSMSEAVMSTIPEIFMAYGMNREVKKPSGNRNEGMAPHGCYRCQGDDNWVAIAVGNDGEWWALSRLLGNPPWTRQKKFATAAGRLANQDELDTRIGEWTRQRPAGEVVEVLQKAGIAAGISHDLDGLIADRHLNGRDFFVRRKHPAGGEGLQVRAPWLITGHPAPHHPPPRLGEHSRDIICDLLGKSEEEFQRLVEEKVIY
ncbi:MAG: CoA transferase [Chloroflexi bacterium]|nr:CoA transferase [Chloroflexota bacterium]